MSIYEIPGRGMPLRQRHQLEQMQAKIQQGVSVAAVDATSENVSFTLTPTILLNPREPNSETFAVSGVTTTNFITLISAPAIVDSEYVISAYVSADNEITVTWVQSDSNTPYTPPSGTYTFRIIR